MVLPQHGDLPGLAPPSSSPHLAAGAVAAPVGVWAARLAGLSIQTLPEGAGPRQVGMGRLALAGQGARGLGRFPAADDAAAAVP